MYVWNENLIVERPTIPSGRRILAVSDIHGNLPYFDGLLKKAGFGADDTLIIAGDFLERGDYCLATLRRVMYSFHHKTLHKKFAVGFPAITVVQIVLLVLLISGK